VTDTPSRSCGDFDDDARAHVIIERGIPKGGPGFTVVRVQTG